MFEFYQPIPPSKEIQENQIPTNPSLTRDSLRHISAETSAFRIRCLLKRKVYITASRIIRGRNHADEESFDNGGETNLRIGTDLGYANFLEKRHKILVLQVVAISAFRAKLHG